MESPSVDTKAVYKLVQVTILCTNSPQVPLCVVLLDLHQADPVSNTGYYTK